MYQFRKNKLWNLYSIKHYITTHATLYLSFKHVVGIMMIVQGETFLNNKNVFLLKPSNDTLSLLFFF